VERPRGQPTSVPDSADRSHVASVAGIVWESKPVPRRPQQAVVVKDPIRVAWNCEAGQDCAHYMASLAEAILLGQATSAFILIVNDDNHVIWADCRDSLIEIAAVINIRKPRRRFLGVLVASIGNLLNQS
jgi:hypothetical protein